MAAVVKSWASRPTDAALTWILSRAPSCSIAAPKPPPPRLWRPCLRRPTSSPLPFPLHDRSEIRIMRRWRTDVCHRRVTAPLMGTGAGQTKHEEERNLPVVSSLLSLPRRGGGCACNRLLCHVHLSFSDTCGCASFCVLHFSFVCVCRAVFCVAGPSRAYLIYTLFGAPLFGTRSLLLTMTSRKSLLCVGAACVAAGGLFVNTSLASV